MATTINEVRTQFTTQGAGKTVKATEQVTKAQTRLGQTSASAGRQFSAQAQGLGGLVGAYAGAAATIFAVTQAFDALNRAARAEQTITGVNALANAIGESGPKILKAIQEITKGQLSLVQSAELANLALSSGFSSKQIENLAGIALKASRALGRDLTDSFNRLVRGVAKLEPELLDELGIFVRIEPAAEAYAASIGKVASQLSNFEKRQAFANAVADEGTDKFKNIDTSAATASQSLEKFAATLSDLGTEVGGFIANALQPLVQALTAPGAAIGAFGILTRAVFGTAIREARGSIDKFGDAAQRGGDRVADFLGNTRKAGEANKEFSSSLKNVKANTLLNSTADDKRLRQLVSLGKTQKLNTSQLREFNTLSKQALQITEDNIAQLKAENNLTEKKQKILGKLEDRQISLNAAVLASNKRNKESGKIAQGVGTAFGKAGKGIAAAGRFTLGIIGGLATFITVASIVVTIGAQLAQAFGWTESIGNFISEIVFQFKRLLGITKELKAEAAVAKAADFVGPFAADDKVQAGQFINAAAQEDNEILKKSGKDLNAAIIEGAKEGLRGSKLADFVAEEMFGAGFRNNLIDLNPQTRQAIEAAGDEAAKIFGGGFVSGVEAFAEATGRTIQTATDQLNADARGRLQFRGATGPAVEFERATSATRTEDLKGINRRNEERVNALQIQELEVALQEKLNKGTANAESIEKSIGALRNKRLGLIQREQFLKEQINKTTGQEKFDNIELLFIVQDNLKQNELAEKSTKNQASLQLTILNARKEILKTFKSQIAAAEKIKDLFILEGDSLRLATSAADKRKAQSKFLQESLSLGKEFLIAQKEGKGVVGDQAQLAALARDAQAALLGNFVKAVEEAKKLTEQLDKQEKKLKAQKETLELQIQLQKIINDERTLKIQKEVADIRLNSAKATLETEIKLAKVKEDAAKIDRNASAERAKNIAAEFGDLISPQKQRALELRLAQRDLAALKASIDQQKVNAEKLAQIEKDKVIAQNALLAAQLGGGANAAEGTIQRRAKAEAALAEQRITADAEARKAELEASRIRNQGIQAELKGFRDHVDGIAQVLTADIVERKKLSLSEGAFEAEARLAAIGDQSLLKRAGLEGADINNLDADQARRILFEEQLAKTTPQVSAELDKLTSKLMANEARFGELTKQIDANTQAQLRLDRLKRQGATDAEIAKAQAKLDAGEQQLANIQKDLEAKTGSLNNELIKGQAAIDNLREKHKTANDVFLQVAKEIATNISERFAQGLRDLNTAIQEGTLTMENFKQGVKDMFVGMLKSVQQTIFEKTVVEPAKQFVSDTVLGALGIEPEKKIENALVRVPGGTAMRVVMDGGNQTGTTPGNPLSSLFPNGIGQSMEEVGVDEGLVQGFNNIAGSGTDLTEANTALQQSTNTLRSSFQQMELSANPLTSLFGGVAGGLTDFGSSLFSMAGSLLGSFGGGGQEGSGVLGLLGTVGRFAMSAFLPAATGGLVHMAAGGMMRDRVPALLEPGEFVIRKPMAKAIGGPALNAMNGTGAMPGGNVVVNIENRGTPQDAEAKQPRFDGEKFVIDIVTRDLRNNGPIRKSMRGDR